MNRGQLRDKLYDESVRTNIPADDLIDDAITMCNAHLGRSDELGREPGDTNEVLNKWPMVYFYGALVRVNEWAKDWDEVNLFMGRWRAEIRKLNVSNASAGGWTGAPQPVHKSEAEEALDGT